MSGVRSACVSITMASRWTRCARAARSSSTWSVARDAPTPATKAAMPVASGRRRVCTEQASELEAGAQTELPRILYQCDAAVVRIQPVAGQLVRRIVIEHALQVGK